MNTFIAATIAYYVILIPAIITGIDRTARLINSVNIYEQQRQHSLESVSILRSHFSFYASILNSI